MGLTEFLANYATQIIDQVGYWGVFLMMVAESMILPMPSEAVMPFAGFLIALGRMNFLSVIIVSTLGSLVGSLVSYYIGKYGGQPFLFKFGKYLLLSQADYYKTQEFFSRRGELAIFISRFIPIVRHFISIPAGLANMPIGRFLLFTALGAAGWNAFLAWVGFAIQQNWTEIMRYSKIIDIFVFIAIFVFLAVFIKKHRQNQKLHSKASVINVQESKKP